MMDKIYILIPIVYNFETYDSYASIEDEYIIYKDHDLIKKHMKENSVEIFRDLVSDIDIPDDFLSGISSRDYNKRKNIYYKFIEDNNLDVKLKDIDKDFFLIDFEKINDDIIFDLIQNLGISFYEIKQCKFVDVLD